MCRCGIFRNKAMDVRKTSLKQARKSSLGKGSRTETRDMSTCPRAGSQLVEDNSAGVEYIFKCDKCGEAQDVTFYGGQDPEEYSKRYEMRCGVWPPEHKCLGRLFYVRE